MKIAFCISGVPYLSHPIEFIKKYSEKHETFVFIHHWEVQNQNKVQHHSYSGRTYIPFDHKIYQDACCWLQVEKELFEDKIPYFREIQKNWAEVDAAKGTHAHRLDVGPISMYYGIEMSQKLRQEYEKAYDMKFDVVMRCRFETHFEPDAPDHLKELEQYDMSKIWIPRYNQRFEDVFAMSSSANMDKYCTVFSNIIPLVKKVGLEPEFLIGEHVTSQNIPYDRIDFVSRFCRFGFGTIGCVITPEIPEENNNK